MNIRLLDSQLRLLDSETRIPFRYGSACLTKCPQAILRVEVEAEGKRQFGYSGDCLPPSWFDKSPDKSYATQIEDMLGVIRTAQSVSAQRLRSPSPLFPAWQDISAEVRRVVAGQQLPGLLACFGVSMVERALMDAVCRVAEKSFGDAVRSNLFAVRPGDAFAALKDVAFGEWLPQRPLDRIHVRHTVGLTDPLTDAEIADAERLNDGYPQALEQYIAQTGIRYLKIKVSNQPDSDLQRLQTIAGLIEKYRGDDYFVTLDGNEQYGTADEFAALVECIKADAGLRTLWNNTLLIEQPLARQSALSASQAGGIHALSQHKPVIIDESDEDLDSFSRAIELGYRGVSSKNCKGPMRSLLNAGLVWLHNGRQAAGSYVISGEDLCCVGVIPVQADLCLVATLGLSHVERNGHHYHPGLSYLPRSEQESAIAAHPDFYKRYGEVIRPHVREGQFHIRSLVEAAGFGFSVEPEFDLG